MLKHATPVYNEKHQQYQPMKHMRRIPVKMGHITNWQITVLKHIS